MAIGNFFKTSSTIENPSSVVGKHGASGFGSATTVFCRFEKTSRTMVKPDGEKTPIDGVVFYPASTTVLIGGRLTIAAVAYRVLAIEDVQGRGGSTHHFELMVQQWSFGS